jgi:hypothetical protein
MPVTINGTTGITTPNLINGSSLNFRNKIINGGFDFWQRGTSFTGIGVGTFTADRWTTSSPTATLNKNVSRQTLSDSDLPATEAGLKYFLRGSYTSGTGVQEWVICNPIELTTTGSASPFKVGKTYTVSYYAKCSSAASIEYGIQCRDLSSSTTNPIIVVENTPQNITTSWARYSYNFTMVSPNPTNTSLCVFFRNGLGLPINTNIDITGVQLEEGSVVTPFENRPIGTELALCQRYYRYFDLVGQKFQSVSATLNMQFITENLLFGSPMRVAPTGIVGNVYYYDQPTARREVLDGTILVAGHGASGVPTNTSCVIIYLASGTYTMYGWYAEDIKLNSEL